jgi:predicted short-subunit dehydrogenase-like oxidoreductase (DUF2520 family)
MAKRTDKAVIIGYGKLGSHLSYALKKSGKVKITGVIKKAKSKLSHSLIKNADIIFITTQDSKIKNAVKSLSHISFDLKDKFIFHTSGSLTSGELSALELKGAHSGSFHPVQTFESQARKDEGRFKKIYIAAEGSEKAVRKSKQLSRLLGSKSFVISKENKIYHHICCVIASNFMATLMSQIEKIGTEMRAGKHGKRIQKNGFNNPSFFNIYKPLAAQSLENIALKGAAKSLTGPFERNDVETITGHLEKMSGELLPLYILMGIETVKLSLEKKSIKPRDAADIIKQFDKSLKINKIR